jgi:hypothetical protein
MQLSRSAKANATAKVFTQYKMPIRVVSLAFDLCVLYYRSQCTQHSLANENTSKERDFPSTLSMAYTTSSNFWPLGSVKVFDRSVLFSKNVHAVGQSISKEYDGFKFWMKRMVAKQMPKNMLNVQVTLHF